MIQIDEETRIQTDKYNYILERLEEVKKKKDKTIEKEWKVQGYYGSLESVLQAVLDMRVKDSTFNDIKSLHDFIKHSQKELKEQFKGFVLKG